MEINFRVIHDPYYGHGFDVSTTTASEVTYGGGVSLGVTDSLFKINLNLTPPFDTNKLNTLGAEEGVGGFTELGLKVCVLWLQLTVSIYRHKDKDWFSGIKDKFDELLQVNK